MIQDWKLRDRMRAAIDAANGDLEAAAKELGMSAEALDRKVKRPQQRADEE